jgi:hypothetical protein
VTDTCATCGLEHPIDDGASREQRLEECVRALGEALGDLVDLLTLRGGQP